MSKAASPVQRRLAALFCADVAGYSRLMSADEVGTLRLLTAHREMADRLIPLHGGRVANTAGDSILAEFPSAVDALQCALRIQERIAAMHEEMPQERRAEFRIGLHVGEAMVQDGDLFGDGVNIAARMENLAEPGTVCLSASTYEFVHRVLPLIYEDLGPQAVKNLDVPIRTYLVRAAVPPVSRAIPPVHRIHDFYLARRFHAAFFDPLAELMAHDGLDPADAPILSSLNESPGIDEGTLSQRLGMQRAHMRRCLERLAGGGLVQQGAAAPGQDSGLSLTPPGREMHHRLYPAFLSIRDRVMAPLSEAERHTLHSLLARVVNANEATARPDDR